MSSQTKGKSNVQRMLSKVVKNNAIEPSQKLLVTQIDQKVKQTPKCIPTPKPVLDIATPVEQMTQKCSQLIGRVNKHAEHYERLLQAEIKHVEDYYDSIVAKIRDIKLQVKAKLEDHLRDVLFVFKNKAAELKRKIDELMQIESKHISIESELQALDRSMSVQVCLVTVVPLSDVEVAQWVDRLVLKSVNACAPLPDVSHQVQVPFNEGNAQTIAIPDNESDDQDDNLICDEEEEQINGVLAANSAPKQPVKKQLSLSSVILEEDSCEDSIAAHD